MASGFLSGITPNMRLAIGMGLMGQNPWQGAMQGIAQGQAMDLAKEDRDWTKWQREQAVKQAQQKAQQNAAWRASMGLPATGSPTPLAGALRAATGAPTPPTGALPPAATTPSPAGAPVATTGAPTAAQPNRLMQDILRRKWENLGQPIPPTNMGGVTPTPSRGSTVPPMQAAGGMAATGAPTPLTGGLTGPVPGSGVDPNYLPPGMTMPTGQTSPAGRQVYTTPGGQNYSEKSITVTHPSINGGQPTNIPSVYGGQVLSEPEAIARIAQAGGKDPETGRALPAFSTIPEAVNAAKARSAGLATARPMAAALAAPGGPTANNPYSAIPEPLRRIFGSMGAERGQQAAAQWMINQQKPQAAPTPTTLMKNARAIGLEPGSPEYQEFIRNQLTEDDEPLVQNIIGAGESQQMKERGKLLAKEMDEVQAAGRDSLTTLRRLNQTENLLKDLNTGSFAQQKVAGKKLAKAIGVDLEAMGITDDVAQAEALKTLGGEFALDYIAQTKGAISEREMDLFTTMPPNVTNTPEGNQLIIDMARDVAKNQREVAKIYREYARQNNGVIDYGVVDEVDVFYEANPVVTPERQTEIDRLAGVMPAGEVTKTIDGVQYRKTGPGPADWEPVNG